MTHPNARAGAKPRTSLSPAPLSRRGTSPACGPGVSQPLSGGVMLAASLSRYLQAASRLPSAAAWKADTHPRKGGDAVRAAAFRGMQQQTRAPSTSRSSARPALDPQEAA